MTFATSAERVVLVAARKAKYKHPLVEILWVDAETGHGWEEHDEIDVALPTAVTVGFLIRETEDAYLVASTYSDTATNARIKIPKGMMKQFTVLK